MGSIWGAAGGLVLVCEWKQIGGSAPFFVVLEATRRSRKRSFPGCASPRSIIGLRSDFRWEAARAKTTIMG